MTQHSASTTTAGSPVRAAMLFLASLLLFLSINVWIANDAKAQTPCNFRNFSFTCYGAVVIPNINPIPLGSALTLTVQPGSTYRFHPQTVILAEPINGVGLGVGLRELCGNRNRCQLNSSTSLTLNIPNDLSAQQLLLNQRFRLLAATFSPFYDLALGISDVSFVAANASGGSVATRRLNAGWNLISSPVEVLKSIAAFGGCTLLDRNGVVRNVAYQWDTRRGAYFETGVLTTNAGAFIRVRSACTIQVAGTDQGGPAFYPSGWVIVSTRNQTWNQARGACPITTLWTDWNGQGYRAVNPVFEVLDDFNGYWAFFSNPNGGSCKSNTQGIKPIPMLEGHFELPPPPPGSEEEELGAIPMINSIELPREIALNGSAEGVIRFSDPDADVLLLEMREVEWFTPGVLDLQVFGQSSAEIGFVIECYDKVGMSVVDMVLVDAKDHESKPWRLEFSCVEQLGESAPNPLFAPETFGNQPLRVQKVNALASPEGMRFHIQGQGINQMELRVFDLAGTLVFDDSVLAGNTLHWNMLSSHGQRVSNGVYLYVVTIQGVDGSARNVSGKVAVLQ